MKPDGVIDALAQLLADLQIFFVTPTTNVLLTKIGVQPVGKSFILSAVRNERRIKLDRLANAGTEEADVLVRNACAFEKYFNSGLVGGVFGEIGSRQFKRIHSNGRRSFVNGILQSLYTY